MVNGVQDDHETEVRPPDGGELGDLEVRADSFQVANVVLDSQPRGVRDWIGQPSVSHVIGDDGVAVGELLEAIEEVQSKRGDDHRAVTDPLVVQADTIGSPDIARLDAEVVWLDDRASNACVVRGR